MRYLKFSVCVLFILTSVLNAQNKQITLKDIWSGSFRAESMDVLHSMANGKQYSVLNFDRATMATTIDIYDYKTQQKVKTLVSSANLSSMQYFSNYTFSADEKKIILATNETPIYRHSAVGNYFVYNVEDETLEPISKELIQEPTFSPNGTKIAYAFNNNLFVKDLNTGETIQITSDGKKNSIINGITDWVYEEEFAFVRAFEWSADSQKIAFIKFDETNVPEFSMDVYGEALYQTQHVFKYPKAGEPNSKVSLHVHNLISSTTTNINLDEKAYYIPRLQWTNNANMLSFQILNRKQNNLYVMRFNTETNTTHVLLNETDKAYVDVTDNLTFLDDNSFIWTSEKDGYNHIYHYDNNGKLINQVTKGNWDVTNYYGYNPKAKRIFYQSVENGSINRDVYSIKINGRDKKRLSNNEGTNNASFSADFSYFINTFSNATTPTQYTLNNAVNGSVISKIVDNAALAKKIENYTISKKEFSTININGNDLNMWMLKPANFDASKQYPLFMTQYSGPGSQSVSNSWNSYNDYWYQMLAQQGFIVVCVDGRGTGFKGAVFKKVTQNQLGKYEVEDQIAAAKKLGALPYINADKIGIWGWSYGGFMSSNCLFKGYDTFKMAIAVAPVTSWRFYDTVYTERYMATPQENPSGYDDNSPINHVDKLQGDFLLVHGTADDNVHVQNTMRLVEALVQANKQFDWAIYPDKNHGIYGGNTRLHLYEKMTNFILNSLGN
ncbi:S9 family peptidase [Seonamhaeicola algicola]|uniref:S9 family peptidase n=1 Tax=Seonamhaeicola algicola TaxID=1719036 RepID=A0A5C7AIG6_9FLAO|nr:S9 family peptidase [Seonamhaeicola algicola]TXE07273.1 S9 family peptidase [Seonamhaeicola algicola]